MRAGWNRGRRVGAIRPCSTVLRRAALLLAIALLPQAAHPVSLDQLLTMPLERLLQLQLSGPATGPPRQQEVPGPRQGSRP